MLNIHNLSISFQGDYLFENISFKLTPGDRVGLIGKNGAGKSTMLKILSKDLEPDSGQIATDKHLKIGFLRQDIDFIQGRTVLEESYEAFQEIKVIEHQLETTIGALGNKSSQFTTTLSLFMASTCLPL